MITRYKYDGECLKVFLDEDVKSFLSFKKGEVSTYQDILDAVEAKLQKQVNDTEAMNTIIHALNNAGAVDIGIS